MKLRRLQIPRRFLLAAGWLSLVALAAVPAWPLPAPLELEDRPKPLVASRARTEADLDRIEALALLATGRTYEQRQEYVKALQNYERAQRCDPAASSILEALIPLAVQLKQYPVAVRYAMRAGQAENLRPLLLRRLGVYLTELGEIPQAVTMYEKVLAARIGAKPDAADVIIWTELGRLYHLAEQYAKAAEQFSRVLGALEHPADFGLDEEIRKAILGEPGPTYQLFGECFLLSGRVPQAAAAFEKAQALAPNEALWKYNQARVAARSGKPEPALADLEESFRKHLAGQGLGPYELLAEVLQKLGRQKELFDRLEKLRAAEPKNVPLGYFLAGRYLQAHEFDKAQPLYALLLKSAPTTIAYRSLAEIYRKTKRTDALLELLGEGVEKTGTPDVFGAEAKTIRQDAALLGSLADAARRQLKAQPEKLTYHQRLALALLLLDNKQYDQAGEWFELALAAAPKQAGETFLLWGGGLLLGERAAEATKVLQRGIDARTLPKDNPALDFYLAGALAMNDRTDDALAAARKAAGLKKSARLASRVPWILYHAKRYPEAIRAYEELLAKFDPDTAAETREVLLEARLALSNLCVLSHDLPAAEEWLEQALDEFPDDVSASNDLGYLWADQGKHLHRALAMIQKAVAAEPDNTAYRDSLGWVLFRLGRCQEAVPELEKATADKKPDALVFDHLGDACSAIHQDQRALTAWRRAAELYRTEKDDAKCKEVEAKTKQLETKK
ncbi:MAG: tetratricopeptide repeat protein [Thermoguttaceae bacterium]|jgi:tetratricopeptide (TPR) repeat protein